MFKATSITSENYKEKEDNKIICDALGCIDKATEKIKINAGKFGFVELDLCKRCKIFFDNQGIHQNNQKQNIDNKKANIILHTST